MKFKIKSKKQLRNERFDREDKWHRKFAWIPSRISDTEVVWLGTYFRRRNSTMITWETMSVADAMKKRLAGNDLDDNNTERGDCDCDCSGGP